jgi:hypothetical protein
MSLNVSTLAQQIAAIEMIIEEQRKDGAPSYNATMFHALTAIAADLRARSKLPNSAALAELEKVLFRMKAGKTSHGWYDEGKMIAVANVMVANWHTIRQALESFGEKSSE